MTEIKLLTEYDKRQDNIQVLFLELDNQIARLKYLCDDILKTMKGGDNEKNHNE